MYIPLYAELYMSKLSSIFMDERMDLLCYIGVAYYLELILFWILLNFNAICGLKKLSNIYAFL